jgi:hypothetical protein
MAALLEVAPRVRPGTVVIVTGVPKSADPFGHNMWFDMALRLAYPGVRVAGIYVYDTGKLSTGANMAVSDRRWVQIPSVSSSLIADAPVSQTLVVHLDANGRGRTLTRLPSAVANAPRTTLEPQAVISGSELSDMARRRYELAE